MTPIEIMAVIFAVFILVKIGIILIDPKIWMNKVVNPIFKKSRLAFLVCLVFLVIIGNYILSVFDIVQIAAVMLFTSLLMALSFLWYPKVVLRMKKDFLKTDMRKAWILMLIWVVIAAWILHTVFSC